MESKTASPCVEALRIVAAQRFAELRGLPGGCTTTDVRVVFPSLSTTAGVGSLGSGHRQYRHRGLRLDGHSHMARAWFDGEELALIDIEYPTPAPAMTWTALRERLGEPAARLDVTWGVLPLASAEWVYAASGLAVVVNPDNDILIHAAAFSPTTLEHYREALRLDLAHHELPE
jgi:hypothetical protein